MSAFKEVLAARSKQPGDHFVLEKTAFADDCPSKPADDLALGLRRVSDNDVQIARAEAAKYAIEMHPNDREGAIEAYNDALMRWMIIFGACDPNDVTKPAPFFEGSEENVRMTLTSGAIRYAWDRIDRFHAETSPLVTPASDDDIQALAAILTSSEVFSPLLSKGQVLRMRKLFGFILNEFREAMQTEEAVIDAVTEAVTGGDG